MRRLLRSPLTWIVSAEIIVVGLLVFMAWGVVAGAAKSVVLSPTLQIPGMADDGTSALPDFPLQTTPQDRGPQPGLNLSSRFWRDRLVQLNRDQELLARLEWRLVHGAMDAARRYLETVVLPAVRRAEHPRGQPVR
jgi:hypothetical protein